PPAQWPCLNQTEREPETPTATHPETPDDFERATCVALRLGTAHSTILPLRDNAFKPEFARMSKDGLASPSMCSLKRMAAPALAKIISSVALRPSTRRAMAAFAKSWPRE